MPNVSVRGLVATRDNLPYVHILKDDQIVVQLSIAESRNVAMDILRSASYAEADAMLVRFFAKMDLPKEALYNLMLEFRQFRHELDTEPIETTVTSPDGLKGPFNA